MRSLVTCAAPSGLLLGRRFGQLFGPFCSLWLLLALAGCSAPQSAAPVGSGTSATDDSAMSLDDGADSRNLERSSAAVVSEAEPGIVVPYPLDHIIGTFSDCRGSGRTHAGLDIAGTGDLLGLGDRIYALARSEITMIGRPEEDADRFGRPDLRDGTTDRDEVTLPRSEVISGYGEVNFFTRTYGSWHSGTILVTTVTDGPYAGYQVRYMHLGAIHPELRVGDVVEAGQEIGLMGGTAVMHDAPHVHIDIEDTDGDRIDVAPLVGLEGDPGRCRR